MTDLRFALRSLAKSPLFFAVALFSLAVGIGANTAVFSITKAILLRSLPVPEPRQLRLVHWTGTDVSLYNFTGGFEQRDRRAQSGTFSYPAFRDLQDSAAGLAEVFAWFPLYRVTVKTRDGIGLSAGMMVSGNYFKGYGAHAQRGRTLTAEDDQAGADPVVVITDRFWERQFARDPGALGEVIIINRHPFTIVGILSAGYAGPMMGDPADLYVALAEQPRFDPDRSLTSYDNWWVVPMLRLAPGTNEAQLRSLLTSAFTHGLAQGSSRMEQPEVLLPSGHRGVIDARRAVLPILAGLQAIVAVVLVIACANVAGLSLARALARRREFAVCAAIGASRGHLLRRALTESLLLALGGAMAGLLLASWIKAGLLAYLPHDGGDMHFDTSTDVRVLLFTLGVAAVAAVACGLVPAWRAARTDPARDLAAGRVAGLTRQRLGRFLVATQVGCSIVLVAGTGLFARSIGNLRAVEPGFDPRNLLLFGLHAERSAYDAAQRVAFFDRVCAALAGIPGVSAVGLADVRLVSGSVSTNGFSLPGRERRPEETWQTNVMTVGDGYFAAMRIPLTAGREFGSGDRAESPAVVVVNERFAREHFPNESPLDRVVRVGRTDYHIVGVCQSTLYNEVKGGKPSTLYFCGRQKSPETAWVALRTTVPPRIIVPAAREAVAKLDPLMPLAEVTTQAELLDRSLFLERMFASLCGALGGLAVLLSCIGLYGLLAYNVAQRRTEIGVRMALGARPGAVAWAMVRDAILLCAWGLAAGLLLTLGLGTAARGVFFAVTPYDPPIITVATLGLLVVAALAAWLPARRAARIDPLVALRSD